MNKNNTTMVLMWYLLGAFLVFNGSRNIFEAFATIDPYAIIVNFVIIILGSLIVTGTSFYIYHVESKKINLNEREK
jgi:hypothetical protein